MEAMVADRASDQYWAGLFDGEGCFRIVRQNRKHGALYYCSVTIRMRDDSHYLLKRIGEEFGVALYTYSRSKSGGIKRNPSATVEFRGPKAEEVCRRLLPFLVIKRDQAELLIRFERLRMASHESEIRRGAGYGSGGRRLPESYYQKAEEMYLECRAMKRYRGRS